MNKIKKYRRLLIKYKWFFIAMFAAEIWGRYTNISYLFAVVFLYGIFSRIENIIKATMKKDKDQLKVNLLFLAIIIVIGFGIVIVTQYYFK